MEETKQDLINRKNYLEGLVDGYFRKVNAINDKISRLEKAKSALAGYKQIIDKQKGNVNDEFKDCSDSKDWKGSNRNKANTYKNQIDTSFGDSGWDLLWINDAITREIIALNVQKDPLVQAIGSAQDTIRSLANAIFHFE